MPAPASGYPVYHALHSNDVALRQRRRERHAALPVLIASRTLGSARQRSPRSRPPGSLRRRSAMANLIGELITGGQARITDQPPLPTTSNHDFSGTKPRMTGSAAISAAGGWNPNCPRYFASYRHATGQSPSWRPRHAIELASCGRRRNCAFYCQFHGVEEYDIVRSPPGGQKAAIASAKRQVQSHRRTRY